MNKNAFSQAILGKCHMIWDWNGTLLNDIDHAVARCREEGLRQSVLSATDQKRCATRLRNHHHQVFELALEVSATIFETAL